MPESMLQGDTKLSVLCCLAGWCFRYACSQSQIYFAGRSTQLFEDLAKCLIIDLLRPILLFSSWVHEWLNALCHLMSIILGNKQSKVRHLHWTSSTARCNWAKVAYSLIDISRYQWYFSAKFNVGVTPLWHHCTEWCFWFFFVYL